MKFSQIYGNMLFPNFITLKANQSRLKKRDRGVGTSH